MILKYFDIIIYCPLCCGLHKFYILFQALLRDASNVLYTALDQRAFFKSVTIVVPSSWRDSKCQTIIRPPRGGTQYRNADIHISQRHPIHGEQNLNYCGVCRKFFSYFYVTCLCSHLDFQLEFRFSEKATKV